MAKTPSSLEKIRRQAEDEPEMFRHDELVAAVCKYICRGMTATQVREIVKEKLGIVLNREQPYRLLSFAGQRGWLSFQAPLSYEDAEQLKNRYPWLKEVKVVRTGVSDDISFRVAEMLLERVCRLSESRGPDRAVHIGFAGGRSLRKTARIFAEMLRQPRQNLPKSLVFHAIVAGFVITDPSTDPNNFFTYFAAESALQVQASFVGLPAPGIIDSDEIDELRTISYMREAFDGVRDIDIIVTSAGGHWQEGHSSFYAMLKKGSADTVKKLDEAKCIGDMMWRPLGKNGLLDVRTPKRTMTLLEPRDLPGFVRRNKTVILLLGPCGSCGRPKGDVLAAILSQKNLITHLVADSRSVKQLLDR
jgi:DNA-binding transcriptional regulator LsrR (DeoR family)